MPVELGTCATGDDVKLYKVLYTYTHTKGDREEKRKEGEIDRKTEEETVCFRLLSQGSKEILSSQFLRLHMQLHLSAHTHTHREELA